MSVFTLALNLTFSPPSSLRYDAIAPKPKAKADRRRNSRRPVLVLRMIVRPIPSQVNQGADPGRDEGELNYRGHAGKPGIESES